MLAVSLWPAVVWPWWSQWLGHCCY